MGWWITFGIFVLLAILPLGVRICYDAQGVLVKVLLGPVKITLFPRHQKTKKPIKKTEKKPDKEPVQKTQDLPEPPKQPAAAKSAGKGGSLKDFLPFVKLAVDLLGDFRRKIRIRELHLRLILASSDPCDLAVNYGKTWTAVGNFLPALERCFVIQKRDVEVECDFTASETNVIARLELTITLGRLLSLTAVYAVRGIKEFIVFRKIRKGGVAK